MTKGSGKSGSRAVSVPVKSTVSFKSSGGGVGSYQNKSQVTYSDKQTGSYGRQTTTEKASAGRMGPGEVRNEQTFRNVTYDRSGCGSKSYISYNNNNDGGSYGGGFDSESDVGDQSGGYDSESEDDDQSGGGYYSNSDDGDSDGYGDDSDY